MDGALAAFDRRLNADAAAPLVVGFSGGSDSTALLALAVDWGRARGRPVLAVTIDHGLNPLSTEWTARAAGVAAELGAPFRSLSWEGDKPVTGLPAAARAARLRLLGQATRDAGAKVILLGHTRDDLAEAAQMRRDGSSVGDPAEWAPSPVWPEGRGLFHLRPLLGAGRADLRQQLRARGLGWIEDPANEDQRYARARARAILRGSPSVEPADARRERPDGLARQCRTEPWGGLTIGRGALRAAERRAARRFVQAAAVCAGGSLAPPRAGRAEALLGRLLSEEAFQASLAGARVEADADEVRFWREAGERARRGMQPTTLAPGVVQVWDGRFEVICEREGRIGALAGRSSRLDAAERRLMKGVPASARASLPVFDLADGRLTCPLLAQGSKASCRALAGERLLAACGVITREPVET